MLACAAAFSIFIDEKIDTNKVKVKTLAILLDSFLNNVKGIIREHLLVMCNTLKLCSQINFLFSHDYILPKQDMTNLFLRSNQSGAGRARTYDDQITSAFSRFVYDYLRTEEVDKSWDDGLTNSVELCRIRTGAL